jgi:4-hydroxybenzoate polyprenyltransferase
MRLVLLDLAYCNLWIALSAAGEVLVNQQLLGLPLQWQSSYLAFATMFMVYTFAKTMHFDPQADAVNDPERTALLLRWRRPLIAEALLLYALALWLGHQHGVALWCLFPFATAILYEIKLLPAGWRYRRLKDIPGVKSTVVAGTWAVTTLWMPVLVAGSVPVGTGLLLFWNFLLWFVNTVFFDMGDMKGDRLEGTRTLPLVLGFRRCRALLLLLSGVAAVTLWWGLRQELVGPWASWANLLSLYTFAYVLAARHEEQDLGFLCDVVADGIFLFGAVLLLLWLGLS